MTSVSKAVMDTNKKGPEVVEIAKEWKQGYLHHHQATEVTQKNHT